MAARHELQELVSRADRRARLMAAFERLLIWAPRGAGAGLAIGLVVLLAGGPVWLGVLLVPSGALLPAIVLLAGAMRRAPSAGRALALDTAAGLDGQLSSAYWFVTAPEPARPDEWVEFHVNTATARAREVDWSAVLPAPRPGRSVAIVGGALALSIAVALFVTPPASTPRLPRAELVHLLQGVLTDESLPLELRSELAAELGTVDIRDLTPDQLDSLSAWLAEAAEVNPALQQRLDELARTLSPEQRAELAQAAREAARRDGTRSSESPAARRDARAAEWALEDLAARLAIEREDAGDDAGKETGAAGDGSEDAQNGTPSLNAQAGVQGQLSESRQSVSAAAGRQMMVGMQTGGAPATGAFGMGRSSGPGTPSERLALADALAREIIEASADAGGDNVRSEEARREAEQAQSRLSYTRARAAAAERSHAEPPPRVPDATRPVVEGYFDRR